MAAGPRHGFTLLELLVVMGILLLVAALGISAFQRVGTVNRLTATEYLVADLLRQARLTARTTGAPVVLTIVGKSQPPTVPPTPEVTPAIAGVSRSMLWSCAFEDTDFPVGPAGQATEDDFRARIGRTGTGLRIDPAAATARRLPEPIPTNPPGDRDVRKTALTRRATGNSDGFALTIAVRPPVIGADRALPSVIPLVLITGTATAGTVPEATQAICGLRLELWSKPLAKANKPFPVRLHENAKPEPLPGGTRLDPQYQFWGVQGWIRDESGTLTLVSSEEDATSDLGAVVAADRQGRTQVDAGGAWEELTLLYDGADLLLLRDGLTIARKIRVGPLRLAGYSETPQVVLGQARFTGVFLLPSESPADHLLPQDVILDDVSLARLGVDLPHPLPSGMIPLEDYRVTVRPSGAITIDPPRPPGALGDLEFKGRAEEADLRAAISITPGTGAVVGTQIKAKP